MPLSLFQLFRIFQDSKVRRAPYAIKNKVRPHRARSLLRQNVHMFDVVLNMADDFNRSRLVAMRYLSWSLTPPPEYDDGANPSQHLQLPRPQMYRGAHSTNMTSEWISSFRTTNECDYAVVAWANKRLETLWLESENAGR